MFKGIFNLSINKKIVIYNIVAVVLVSIIVFFWFHRGNLIAGAETGIPFYNLARSANIASYPYVDSQLGIANPFYIHFFPIWKTLEIFSFTGLPEYLIQAVLFFVLLIIPLIVIPKLFQELFGRKDFFLGVVAGVFYVFNLYTVSQVWVRFLYSLIFLWSLLPLFLYLWILWVKEHKAKIIIAFYILSVLFAGTFALPTGIFAVWFTLFLFSLIALFGSKAKLKIIFLSFFGFIGWLVISSWWLLPFIQQRNNIYASNLGSNSNLESLVEVSHYFQNKDIFLLRQKYFFDNNTLLGVVGNDQLTTIVSISVFLLLLIGLIDLKKTKSLYPFLILLFIGWFISKGSNPPFGYEFYKFIYSKVPLLQIFRNPYEKFGAIYLLGYSVFFAFGLIKFSKFFGRFKIYFVLLFLLFDIYSLSKIYFTDKYFPGIKQVEVPNYYSEITKAMEGNQRIIQLPLLPFPSAKYTWGFEGEDPSMYLFDNPSISSSVSMESMDKFYMKIGSALLGGYGNNMLGITNTKYLILDRGKNFGAGLGLSGYQRILSANDKIGLIGTFGDLDFYEYKGPLVDYVYAVSNLVFVEGFEKLTQVIINPDFAISRTAVLDMSETNFKQNELNLTNDPPNLSFSKISPIEYSVDVDSKGSFILILADNFNPLWSAKSGDVVFENHFKVNGFANAWLIDKKGKYKITVKFDSFLSGLSL